MGRWPGRLGGYSKYSGYSSVVQCGEVWCGMVGYSMAW